MSTFKKSQVVMLPTNEKAILGLNSIHNHLFFANDMAEIPTQKYQHLYFLSDEEIKEGDWVYDGSDEPYQWTKGDVEDCLYNLDAKDYKGCKKIIATTDNLLLKDNWLHPEMKEYVPRPSQGFIEKFVEEYNKGNIITEVMVEYYYSTFGSNKEELTDNQKLVPKINPKDNTITIRKVNLKGEHVLNFVNDFIKEFPEENLEYLKLRAESWIEQNLK